MLVFDDIRSRAMALGTVEADGLGIALNSSMIGNRSTLREVIRRGLEELMALHVALGMG